jgi:ANTAR domain
MRNPDFAHEAAGMLSIAHASEPRSLNQLVQLAAREVPGCSGAVAAVWRDGEPVLTAASHPDLAGLSELQHECGRGPAIDALAGDGPASCPDTLDEGRWPEYAAAALRRGVRCSVTLADRSGPTAVTLSLLGARPRDIDPAQIPLAELLTSVGAAALSNASEYGDAQRAVLQLRDAAESRTIVDQAKGILMRSLGCSADEALQRLRTISQTRNMRVTEVAQTVIGSRGTDAG